MDDLNSESVKLLREIKELLVPISACFESQYTELRKQQLGEKLERFREILDSNRNSTRKVIYPLLFDSRGLSQIEIAREAHTTQPTVSRFVSLLREEGFIEQVQDEHGNITYIDKYNLAELIDN